jgi:hypothetical protein
MHLAANRITGLPAAPAERGADAAITDNAHQSTPLGWARFGEQPEAVVLLERHIGS